GPPCSLSALLLPCTARLRECTRCARAAQLAKQVDYTRTLAARHAVEQHAKPGTDLPACSLAHGKEPSCQIACSPTWPRSSTRSRAISEAAAASPRRRLWPG